MQRLSDWFAKFQTAPRPKVDSRNQAILSLKTSAACETMIQTVAQRQAAQLREREHALAALEAERDPKTRARLKARASSLTDALHAEAATLAGLRHRRRLLERNEDLVARGHVPHDLEVLSSEDW